MLHAALFLCCLSAVDPMNDEPPPLPPMPPIVRAPETTTAEKNAPPLPEEPAVEQAPSDDQVPRFGTVDPSADAPAPKPATVYIVGLWFGLHDDGTTRWGFKGVKSDEKGDGSAEAFCLKDGRWNCFYCPIDKDREYMRGKLPTVYPNCPDPKKRAALKEQFARAEKAKQAPQQPQRTIRQVKRTQTRSEP